MNATNLNIKVNKRLFEEFPEFYQQIKEEDCIDLSYIVASYFVSYLLDKYNNNDIDTFKKGLDFIEQLNVNEDSDIKELATIGYLEGMQNLYPQDWIKSEEFLKYLGVESRKWWNKLNEFWSGDTQALKYDSTNN